MNGHITRVLLACWVIGWGVSCRHQGASGKQIFHYNYYSGIASLDPAFAREQSSMWAVHQVYNTLVETDSNLHIVPSLAGSWDISPDRTVYTFHLRRDVFFQDNDAFPGGKGRRLTAYDVVYSLRRIIDPATASSGAWIFHDRVDPQQGFRAVDDSTFRLTLLRPFVPILGLLTMQYCSIVPREVVEKYGKDFRSHPCGTGPFQMKAWEEGQELVLSKNPHYFERDSAGVRLPYLDGIRVSFLDSRATEFLLLQQGELDFVNDLDPSFKDEVLTKRGTLRKEWRGRLVLATHPYLCTEYLGMPSDSSIPSLRNSPLRSRKLRQAINYGFDRRKMIMYLRNSISTPAESGFVPMGLPSFDSSVVKGYSYNPEKARQLLAEAGFPGGKGLPEIKLLTVATYSDFASFIARQLQDIGLHIQVDVVQKGLLLDRMSQGQAWFFVGSWIADYPDAENFLSVFYGKNPAPPNYTHYHNPRFDSLYERALETNNDTLRYGLYRQMDRIVIRDAPVVPLWYDEVIWLVNPRVKGFRPNGLNLLELRRVKLGEKK